MSKLYKILSNLPSILDSKEFNNACNIVFWITIPLLIVLILYGQDIKTWRIKSFQEQKQNLEDVK